MIVLEVLLAVHLSMCIGAYILCKSENEKNWTIFKASCFVPFVGPLFIFILYFIYKMNEESKSPLRRIG